MHGEKIKFLNNQSALGNAPEELGFRLNRW